MAEQMWRVVAVFRVVTLAYAAVGGRRPAGEIHKGLNVVGGV